MLIFDRGEAQSTSQVIAVVEAMGSSSRLNFTEKGKSDSTPMIRETSGQGSNGMSHRSIPKLQPKAKWTAQEDKEFQLLAARRAIGGECFTLEDRAKFVRLRDRRNKLLLRVSAEQELFDRQDRDLRAKARAALREYFEFLESTGDSRKGSSEEAEASR